MKTNDVNLNLDLQAYADGQFDQFAPGRRAELERLLESDPTAKAVVDGVHSVSTLLRTHESAYTVPATREFYWSQVQRRLEAADRADHRQSGAAASKRHWFRWWVPILGAAAVAVSFSLSRGNLPGVSLADGGRSEAGSDESEAVVFRSESDGVTIHWLN